MIPRELLIEGPEAILVERGRRPGGPALEPYPGTRKRMPGSAARKLGELARIGRRRRPPRRGYSPIPIAQGDSAH